MTRELAVGLTAIAGGLVAAQAPINGKLGAAVGRLPAAAVSFAIGLALLALLVVVTGQLRDATGVTDSGLPWWAYVGGALGAGYVVTALSTVGTLGAGGVTAATIAGQLTASVAIDQFGLFGVARQPIHATRVLGVVLLAIGVVLVVRK